MSRLHFAPVPLLAMVLLLGLSATALAQDEKVLWQTYLNVNDVRDLAHDGERLWVATGGGLVRYDPATGETGIAHRSRDGLLSDSLNGVAVASDGRIWCGTERVGISVLDPDADSWEAFTSLFRPIPGDRIRRIAIAGDTLYVGTQQGFAVFDGPDLRDVCLQGIDDLRCGLPSYDVHDLAGDPGGDGVWLATSGGVCHRNALGDLTVYVDGVADPVALRLIRHDSRWVAAFPAGIFALREDLGSWESMAGPRGLTEGFVDLLSEGSTLWAATAEGIWRSDDGGAFALFGAPAFPASSLLRAPDGTLWAGGRDAGELLDGLWRLDAESWTRHAFPGPSVRATYRALAFDRDGVLTVSHARSQSRPMRQRFDGTTWFPPVDLEDWTFDLLFSPEGNLWLAQCCCAETGCNLRRVVDGLPQTLPPRNLRDIVYDESGNLWCASDNAPDQEENAQGVWFLDGVTEEWLQITRDNAPNLLRERVRAVLPLGGDVWIGYSDRGLHHWDLGADQKPLTADDGAWTLYSSEIPNRRLIADNVTRLRAEGTRVWVGTTGGLTLIDPGSVPIQIGAGFLGLPASVVNDVIPLADGGAWVATQNTGLTRMFREQFGFRFVTYGPPDLPHPNVEALALDPDGRSVWAGTSHGLAHLTVTGGGGSSGGDIAAYPNPFIPGCVDGVRLLGLDGTADGVVVDLSGKIVRRFDASATGQVVWDGRDADGRSVAPGLYWIRVSSPQGRRGIGVGVGDGPCSE